MSCVTPLTAYHYYHAYSNDTGEKCEYFSPKIRLVSFDLSEVGQEFEKEIFYEIGVAFEPYILCVRKVVLPCSSCLGCKLARVRDWSNRCVHESQMHEENSFLTLTYDNENLPVYTSKSGVNYSTLVRSHLQSFMKRLRRSLDVKVRFFACGEYGAKFGRPHYHILLFGYDFKDKVLCRSGKDPDRRLYTSQSLSRLWPLGFSAIGSVTPASAAYVSRYVLKKVSGDESFDHYGVRKIITNRFREFDPVKDVHRTDWRIEGKGKVIPLPDKVFYNRLPEFVACSNRPAIGHSWISKYLDECYPADFIVTPDGYKCRLPRYYDKFLKLTDPQLFDIIKQSRLERRSDICPRRLNAKKEILEQRVSRLERVLS